MANYELNNSTNISTLPRVFGIYPNTDILYPHQKAQISVGTDNGVITIGVEIGEPMSLSHAQESLQRIISAISADLLANKMITLQSTEA